MSRLLSLLLLLSIFVPAVAENYPYRNDYLWVTVPDRSEEHTSELQSQR